jgi:hypothetical protein
MRVLLLFLLALAVFAAIVWITASPAVSPRYELPDRWRRGPVATIGAGLVQGATLAVVWDAIVGDNESMEALVTARPGIVRLFTASSLVASVAVVLLALTVASFLRRCALDLWRRHRVRAERRALESRFAAYRAAAVSETWDDAQQRTGPLGDGAERPLTRATAVSWSR